MGAGGGNQYTLAAIATTASHSVPTDTGGWSLQHRHPDGRHWLELGRFATKQLAQETAKAFIAADYGPGEDFRVRKVRFPSD